MKILVLGAGGMLGNAMLRILSEKWGAAVKGTVRSARSAEMLAPQYRDQLVANIDVENTDQLAQIIDQVRPEAIVNCIGLIKQRADANDPLAALPINALLPHRLARLASLAGARVVHFSTDCVFSGTKGGYVEVDPGDAYDLYGRSKYLGELHDPHCVTVRTSIIGHELGSNRSLIGWFLAQQGSVSGYSKAIFSGLPTVELARIVRDFILSRPAMSGLWHVSADPISKLELLRLVARVYDKKIEIVPDDSLIIDRSLDSSRFRLESGYAPPNWPELVALMHRYS